MKRSALFCFLMVCFYLSAQAQLPITDKRYPDSLAQVFKRTRSDSLKARSLYELSEYWCYDDTLKSKTLLDNGLKYGSRYPYLKALYHYYLAGYYFAINMQKSEPYYIEAEKQLSKFDIQDAFLFRSRCWTRRSILEIDIKDNSISSMKMLINEIIPLLKRVDNTRYLAVNYHNIAMIFMEWEQYEKAEKYHQLAISLLEKHPLLNIEDQYKEYISYTKNCLYQNKITLAKKLLNKATTLLPKTRNPRNYMDYYEAEGMYYTITKVYTKALQSLTKGKSLASKEKENYLERNFSLRIYEVFMANEAYEKALTVMQGLVKNKPTYKFSKDYLTYYLGLSETYDKLGNSKMAYTWLKKYAKLKDSINNIDVENKVNALEIKFKTAEKEKKIIALNAENEKANLLSWLFGIACLFLLVVAVLGWLFYRSSKKLAAQKELNHRQQIEDIGRKQQIKLVQAMLDAKEEEQNRIARDLHDGLGGTLSGIKINLSHYATKKNNSDHPELHQIMDQMEGSINELRRIAHDMMPEMLLKFGLEESLRDLCESLASEKLNIAFKYLGTRHTLLPQQQIGIYRIVQEAMHNAVKHAEAKNVLLQCSQNDNIFYITIEDDGKGFDPAYLTKGMGIQNMKNRVAYLNGVIEILSAENNIGTSINIELEVKG